MRQGQQHQQKRMRGRNNNNRKGPNPLSRSYESNGPDVKIRGTAAHIADKYVQLARDAQSSGDPVAAENYLQHAEHYYRILAAAQPQFQTHPGFVRADDESRDEDYEGEDGEGGGYENGQNGYQPMPVNAPQPYGNGQNQPREGREGGYRDNGQRGEGRGDGYRENGPRGEGRGDGYRENGPRGESRGDGYRDNGPRENGPRENREGGQREGAPRGEYREGGRRRERPRGDYEPRPQAANANGEEGNELPAFITGGQAPAAVAPQDDQIQDDQIQSGEVQADAGEQSERSEGPVRRRRRYGRFGRGGAEQGDTPAAEPEVTPGE